MNEITWSYSSATYLSLNSSKIQIGSQKKPQTSAWTIQTAVSNFGSGKKITAISITAYTTATSATYDISAGGSSVKSGSLTTTSNTYTASSLNVTSGNIVISLTGSSTSKAMYLSNISVTYEDATVAITSIEFDKNEASVGVGGTVTITPTISPTGYTETPVWESTNPSVATVSNGVVTGVSAGEATIRLKSPTDATIKAECAVTVTAPVSVTGVSLDETSKALHPGDEFDLTATVAPNNATNKSVTWTSSDDTKATVVNGHVTALAAGTPKITVTTVDGDFTATCDLTITNVAVTGVTLDQDEASIYTGSVGNTVQLTATVTPSNATDKSVSWESSNTSVATVSSTGLVTSVAAGSATITVTTTDGSFTATCDITVEAGPGTADNPYTVAQARAKIDTGTDLNGKYVHGIVSQVDSYNSTYNSITYWISDDGTTTNQMEAYGGLKSKNNASGSFSSKDDLQVGDVVTVCGDLYYYSNKGYYELNSDNYLVYFKRKSASNLTLTSSDEVELGKTSLTPSPTSTITWTTSSTGAMTFTSSNTSVATVTNSGVITAVGAGEATITFSQAADEDYKASTNQTVTVTVTDNRTACATGIDLTSAKTIMKGASAAIAATSTKADGFTGSITYSYSSANSSIFSITDGNYSGAGVGATTVTVTATPTGGNADNYKAASQEVAVTVNGTNSISLDKTSKSVAYGAAAFDIEATVPTENYNGTVSASSSNTAVATVSVDGTTITVTPQSVVGTARITVTAGIGTYYPETAQATFDLTITAPEGKTTFSSEVNVFYESFNTNSGTGGNDGSWNGSIAAADFKADNTWTTSYAKGADQCAKFGTGDYGGSAMTSDIDLEDGVIYTLTFKAGAWNAKSEGTSLSVTASNATIRNEENTADVSSVTMTKGEWTSYTLKLIVADDSEPANVTFSTSGGNKRFFLDEVKVTKPAPSTATVPLNKYGYATYCSVNPIDFSSTTGYTAWRVSGIDGTTITFKKITEAIKGGQGVLLYNKNADGVNTSNVTVNFADGSTVFDSDENKFVGTTAPMYVAADEYIGLKGNKFVPVTSAGTVAAGKALLPASTVSSARELNFLFDDDATGIAEMKTLRIGENENYYNLNGQKVENPTKGLYIVNGKKVVIK